MQHIADRGPVGHDEFHEIIVPAARPVVLRGQVSHWPVVEAGRASPQALSDYLRRFDRGQSVSTMMAPPSAKGRFFYNDDLTGFNFKHGGSKLAAVLDFLLDALDDDGAPTLAAQSVPVRANLTGFEQDNPLPLLPEVEPRVWIGNAGIVAAHHDPSENVACVAAGRRRFTLFPPEQIANLYVGPFELTPAGVPISMVSLENPDFERHPRFRQALEVASAAELEPGDAIYIPYLWWHHVRALTPLNLLVNYWWTPSATADLAPHEAMVHAILAIRDMPAAHRAAWKAVFDHHVFKSQVDPGAHLPEPRRGLLGALSDDMVKSISAALVRALART